MEAELMETLARHQRDSWDKNVELAAARSVAKEIFEFLGGRYHRDGLTKVDADLRNLFTVSEVVVGCVANDTMFKVYLRGDLLEYSVDSYTNVNPARHRFSVSVLADWFSAKTLRTAVELESNTYLRRTAEYRILIALLPQLYTKAVKHASIVLAHDDPMCRDLYV